MRPSYLLSTVLHAYLVVSQQTGHSNDPFPAVSFLSKTNSRGVNVPSTQAAPSTSIKSDVRSSATLSSLPIVVSSVLNTVTRSSNERSPTETQATASQMNTAPSSPSTPTTASTPASKSPPVTAPAPTQTPATINHPANTGAIIVGILGGLAIICIAAVVVVYIRRRHPSKPKPEEASEPPTYDSRPQGGLQELSGQRGLYERQELPGYMGGHGDGMQGGIAELPADVK